MAREDSISRRTVMKLAGAATATAVVAGCTGNGDDDDAEDNGDDNGDDNGADEVEVEAGGRIVLEAITSGWVGQEPAEIEGARNPTFILEEGEEYEIGWEEGDGGVHNIEIVDGDDELVDDDLSTEQVTDTEPDDQFLTFEATAEMEEYVCRPHPQNMRGPLEIVEAENGEEEEEEDDEEENGEDENGEEDDE